MRRDAFRFYIATRLENLPAARDLGERLRAKGFQHTYDWTVHGRVYNPHAEIEGVRRADVVIGLLPGGRGTMHELGAALALNKVVILVGPEEILTGESDVYPCAFHRHYNVVWVSDTDAALSMVDHHFATYLIGVGEENK